MSRAPAAADTPPRSPWRRVVAALGRPRVAIMVLLGFSSGLPFMLVGNTLGYWLREGGVSLSAIGFLAWVGMAYSLKFLWAPLVDKVDAPLLGRWLGRRRGWMATAQLLVAASLAGMAWIGPGGTLWLFGGLALLAAFASATQDIVVDAWRIESAETDDEQALLSAAYQVGYRAALLVTDALILILAAWVGWVLSYELMAMAMGLGLVATWLAREPLRAPDRAGAPALWTAAGLYDAIIGPFVAFFRRHGRWALLMLATVSLYRLADFVMGPMANPMYADLGFDKEVVGAVRGSFGLVSTIAGIAAAGLGAVRLGLAPTLLIGAVIGPASNLSLSWLALSGADPLVLTAAMVIDNFSGGFAGVALVAYMSSLTNIGYTATQYALLSSFYALLGKWLKGFSGTTVEWLGRSHALPEAYALFFLGTALVGLPAVALCLMLVRRPPPPG